MKVIPVNIENFDFSPYNIFFFILVIAKYITFCFLSLLVCFSPYKID
jgi:hypothetical protein